MADRSTTSRDQVTRQPVGRVAAMWRYPVKSMAAEPLEEVEVSWHGVAGDRRWAFVREGMERSGFPWLTIREKPDLLHFRPRLLHPAEPDTSSTRVRTPGGADLDVVSPELSAELGHGVRVIKQDRGVFDTLPLSLITTQSVAAIGSLSGAEIDARRFRPNLLVEAADDEPFAEDGWVGAVLRIGSTLVRIDKRDGRCVVVNVDPQTARRDRSTLRAIAQERDGCLGVYGSTVRPGRIAVGDPVYLEVGAASASAPQVAI